jgi:hypothetical protein
MNEIRCDRHLNCNAKYETCINVDEAFFSIIYISYTDAELRHLTTLIGVLT